MNQTLSLNKSKTKRRENMQSIQPNEPMTGQSPKLGDHLVDLVAQMYESGILYSEAVREFKKRFITKVLHECKGNQCKAARQTGMHRNTMSRTIAELSLDMREFRQPRGRKPAVNVRPATMAKGRIA